LLNREGPDHAPRFIVEVSVGTERASGEGRSKREAEQATAAVMLERVRSRE
jgi:ribonuclease-3